MDGTGLPAILRGRLYFFWCYLLNKIAANEPFEVVSLLYI